MRFLRTAGFGPFAAGVVALCFMGLGCLSAPSPTGSGASVPPKGCTVEGGSPPPIAPNGYYTNGATVCAADATPHQFHGVARPSLEWSSIGDGISAADFALMASWGTNVVRIALNQDFWLPSAALNNPLYPDHVDQAVSWAEAAGLDVILDLHWSDAGDSSVTSTTAQGPGNSGQQMMADTNSIEFWKEVATKYKGDGHVLFELYNEPHGVSWDVWLNGGQSGRFVVAGMQQLYDTVRATGANNVVIAGGLNWAYDLSEVRPTGSYVHGYNVMYATHPYLTSGNSPSGWEASFGHLVTTDFAPVIATEFGDGRKPNCTGDWDQQLIAFLGQRGSWTAWAWYPGIASDDPQGCHFPSLIVDWAGTPSVQGLVVKAALQAYPPVVPRSTPPDGGPGQTDDAPAQVLPDGGSDDAAAAADVSDDAADGTIDGAVE
jgi:hypothetical protein